MYSDHCTNSVNFSQDTLWSHGRRGVKWNARRIDATSIRKGMEQKNVSSMAFEKCYILKQGWLATSTYSVHRRFEAHRLSI